MILHGLSRLLQFAVAIAIGYLALIYRDTSLANLRPHLLWIIPFTLVALLGWQKFTDRKGPLDAIARYLILTLSTGALLLYLGIEGRFHLDRYRVLHADIGELTELGRHLLVGYRDAAELTRLLELRAIAGVFVTRRNLQSLTTQALQHQIADWQALRRQQGLPPLWIATDQEGGIVSRLSPPLTRLPPLAQVIASTDSQTARREQVQQYAETQAKELAALGINLNFAPVVDINKGVKNPQDHHSLIYRRAISDDPEIVASTARDYCLGLNRYQVSCTLKHFPGLGRVMNDTHRLSAQLTTPSQILAKDDWIPFQQNLSLDNAMLMLGHPILTSMDPDHPVSFSKAIVSGLLRQQWGHQGLLITDDFSMNAISHSQEGEAKAALMALQAEVDLILIAFDTDIYYSIMAGLLEARRAGKINDRLLEKSLTRQLQHPPADLSRR
jgi:beta-N-acetylhexosaminidase